MKVAIVQARPAYGNLKESLALVQTWVEKAALEKAEMLVLGETWLSGYPAWIDYCPDMALWNHQATKEAYALMYENSVIVPGEEVDFLAELAYRFGMIIGIGVNERSKTGSLYNSFLLFGPDGVLHTHHRKLMPTYTEKLLYAHGDGNGLKTYTHNSIQIGGLICWEHWMPLARQTLHDQGEHIHIALWPTVHEMHQIASRHYAFEGRCFVLAAGQLMRSTDIPDGLSIPSQSEQPKNQWLLRGGSCVIKPDGKYLLEPCFEEEKLIIAELDLRSILQEKLSMDVSGHYSRNDIFTLSINTKRKPNLL